MRPPLEDDKLLILRVRPANVAALEAGVIGEFGMVKLEGLEDGTYSLSVTGDPEAKANTPEPVKHIDDD